MKPRAHDLPTSAVRQRGAPVTSVPLRFAAALDRSIGLPVRMRFEQAVYSLTHANAHFQDVHLEIERLAVFLSKHGVAVRSAIDVGCGNGVISDRLRDVLGLPEIAGVELNPALAKEARSRGVSVEEADIHVMPIARTYDMVISYGALHHSPNPRRLIRRLRALSNRYVLIVDNSVRHTLWHAITGSAWFPLELSPYRILTVDDVLDSVAESLEIVGTATFRHANVWHDRSFVLAVTR
jgi:trans-aconitate methyltransferase